MAFSKDLVDYVTQLSRLALTPAEQELFQGQLDRIVSYVDQLQELDTENVAPLSHPHDVKNVFREDIPTPSLSVDDALANAPERTPDTFKVPQILE